VVVCDLDGDNAEVLPLVEVVEVVDPYNETVHGQLRWPKYAYTQAQLPVFGSVLDGARDVQIYRADEYGDPTGTPLLFGPLLRPSGGSGGTITAECVDRDWMLWQRTISGIRNNLLSNGSFEDGLTDWDEGIGFVGGAFTNAEASTDWKVLGEQSLLLESNTPGGDQFYEQTFEITAGAIGEYLTVGAWFLLEDIDDPNGHAYQRRGLYVEGRDTGVFQKKNFFPIDNATQTGRELYAETGIHVPPNATWDINVRVYGLKKIRWDAVRVVRMESVSTAGISGSVQGQVDVAEILELIVLHLQNAGEGWSDELIATDFPTTGQTAAKHYQYVDEVPADEAVNEFLERDDVGDLSAVKTATTFTLKLHLTSAGGRGTDRTAGGGAVTLSVGDGGNCVVGDNWGLDGPGTITWSSVKGQGDGPDREEGNYMDASATGGRVIKEVRQAPQRVSTYSLEPLARERVRQYGKPLNSIDLVVESVTLGRTLETGDRVNVDVDDGYIQFAGVARIIRKVERGSDGRAVVTVIEHLEEAS
jgi:hypothetical protein